MTRPRLILEICFKNIITFKLNKNLRADIYVRQYVNTNI